jgi:hypothetical protein
MFHCEVMFSDLFIVELNAFILNMFNTRNWRTTFAHNQN